MTHTDIKTEHWLIQSSPEKIKPYLLLARIDRPVGVWLLLLPAFWALMLASGGLLSLNFTDVKVFILFTIGAVVMRAAGCVINDLWDRKLDVNVERTAGRPLASGAVTVWQAALFLLALLVVGFAILLQFQIVTILLGVLIVPAIFLYPLMKRVTWYPQLFLGVTFNFGILMGVSAVTGVVTLWSLILYVGAIFWTLAYDTIYAHQDIEDDLRIGIKSTAIKFGDKSKRLVNIFYLISFVCAVLAFIGAGAGYLSYAFLLVPAYFARETLTNWDEKDQQNCLRTFRANSKVGLLIFIAACL